MKAKLSIIVPAYNCASTLREAVVSCFEQDFKKNAIPFEVVIVDDGSTDDTRDILKMLATEFSEIRLFFHPVNRGGGAARNTAVVNASGEIVFCLDSDDILPAGTLSKMYLFMTDKKKSNGRCDAVGVHRSIKFKGRFRGTAPEHIERIDTFAYAGEKIPFTSLLQNDGKLCPLYSVFMHTKEAFTKAGGYPEDHGFDTQAFAWRFLAAGLTAYTCPDAEYLHRLHPRGLYSSYYTREARAGRSNKNWFRIFAEFFYLFDDTVKKYILSFDLNSERDILNAVAKGFNLVFKSGYEGLLVPHARGYARTVLTADENAHIREKLAEPSIRNSFGRRLMRKIKKIVMPMHLFLYDIRTRIGARHQFFLILNYIGLRTRQGLKIDFTEDRTDIGDLNEKIDIVVPTTAKDRVVLKQMIDSLKKNVCHPIGKVHILAFENPDIVAFCKDNGYHFVEKKSILGYGEERMPFMYKGVDRSGWVFQQLVKLSGEKIVKTRRYLSVDSDTVLIHPHIFIQGKNNDTVVFRHNTEWHERYFRAFEELFGYEAPTRLSFTSHMMLFDTEYLIAMKKEIEQKKGKSWDQAYIDLIGSNEASPMSDYDTYANWVLYNHPDKVRTKPLYNAGLSRIEFDSLENLTKKYGHRYKTLSFHSWIR